ncbi:MAG: response regulator [Deltaproteobacteria bacterium]|nr:response regulator [Deltaproteobacteria bacterium]
MGYTVFEANGGNKAIESKKDKIDLVILDMIMPDMGGGKVYDVLQSINPDIRVILCSGYSIDDQATEILERGCNSFLQKPFDMNELSTNIRAILEKR